MDDKTVEIKGGDGCSQWGCVAIVFIIAAAYVIVRLAPLLIKH